ncbi:MAG: hypothetical protein ABSC55_25080, partial [Syntrophorhabdales bacterium]
MKGEITAASAAGKTGGSSLNDEDYLTPTRCARSSPQSRRGETRLSHTEITEFTAQPPAATKLLIGMASPMWYEQGYTTYPGSGGCHGDIYTT